MSKLSPELYALALTAAFTGIIWLPIIVNRLVEMGPWAALRNPQPDVRPKADWAYRLGAAHRNAIENLVVYAPLALIIVLTDSGSTLTAAASLTFFFSRVAHAIIYTFGIPLLRTIAFALGFICQMVLLVAVLSAS